MAQQARQLLSRYSWLLLIVLLIACSGAPATSLPAKATPEDRASSAASPQLAASGTSTRATRPGTPGAASPIAATPPTATVAPTRAPTATPTPLPPPAWRPSGALATARYDHSATLLPDGSVLVTGGYAVPSDGKLDELVTPTSERFDPAGGTWRPAGSMVQGRAGHTATLLPNGTVLIVGGFSLDGPLATAEIYDPRTDRWQPTGALQVPRRDHTATLLGDGTVLVAGGETILPATDPDEEADDDVTATAERYDPATGTWQLVGSMAKPRMGHTATLLPGGDVLIVGGTNYTDDDDVGLSVERFSPQTGTWHEAAPLQNWRYGHTATLLPDGTVLVAGGGERETERYDPRTDAWHTSGDLSTDRAAHTATLLQNGAVLFAGGVGGTSYGLLDRVEIYLPDTKTTIIVADLITPRMSHAATLLKDGSVLLIGGLSDYTSDVPFLATTERFSLGSALVARAPETIEYKANFLRWPVYHGEYGLQTSYDTARKGYRATVTGSNTFFGSSVGGTFAIDAPERDLFGNFVLEADVDLVRGSGGGYGLTFRGQRPTGGKRIGANYTFYITPDGQFSLYQVVDDTTVRTLQPPVYSAAILPGAVVNHLQVTCKGDTILLAINGKPVGQYRAEIRNAGWVGVFVTGFDSPDDVEVLFTNLHVTPTP